MQGALHLMRTVCYDLLANRDNYGEKGHNSSLERELLIGNGSAGFLGERMLYGG